MKAKIADGGKMEDHKIVDLYWDRSENAIVETQSKYGKLLYRLSFSLLSSHEDAEECVNDTYVAAWNSMPSDRPELLRPYLCKIDRRISVNKYNSLHREKRGGASLIIEELNDCIPSDSDTLSNYENKRIGETINSFLATLDTEKRVVFVKRYFYSSSIEEIARQMRMSEGKVKSILFRLRKRLYLILEEEDLL